jgi:hypothetical protein
MISSRQDKDSAMQNRDHYSHHARLSLQQTNYINYPDADDSIHYKLALAARLGDWYLPCFVVNRSQNDKSDRVVSTKKPGKEVL